MRESALRLQDKNVLLTGPFNGITQAILRSFTEFGADVGYVSDHGVGAAKYVEAINEGREVHSHYGRALYFNLPVVTDTQIQEIMGRLVEGLGRMDVLVDASPLSWNAETRAPLWGQMAQALAEKLIPFLLAKQRGRVVYVFEDPCLDILRTTPLAPGCHQVVGETIRTLARKYVGQNVLVNGLSIGITDDFILRRHPGSPSLKKSFEEIQRTHTGLKLVDFNEVALNTAYLGGAMSAGVTGETLRLTHGYHLTEERGLVEPPQVRPSA